MQCRKKLMTMLYTEYVLEAYKFKAIFTWAEQVTQSLCIT